MPTPRPKQVSKRIRSRTELAWLIGIAVQPQPFFVAHMRQGFRLAEPDLLLPPAERAHYRERLAKLQADDESRRKRGYNS